MNVDNEAMTPLPDEDRIDPLREFERKFLVDETSIVNNLDGAAITQAYLWRANGYVVRVRHWQMRDQEGRVTDGPASLTLKGPRAANGSRLEVESELPIDDALAITANASDVVSKVRYQLISEGSVFEIDEFTGANAGLWVAEYEASERSVNLIKKPWWASREVTGDPRFDNENLARAPFRSWPENQ